MADKKNNCPVTDDEDCSWREGVCPYFLRDRGHGRVYCEGTVFRFPDIEARREYVYTFCAHPDGFRKCPLKQIMDRYYDRKYGGRELSEPASPCQACCERKPTHRKYRKRGRRKETQKYE